MLTTIKLFFKKEAVLNGFFFLFIGFILLQRLFLFLTVNQDCIDNDQVVMWSGAKHFSQGLFYVPRYYGQDYNTMMEGLFAAPWIKLGVSVYYAVPIATHIIFLTPFLFTAFYLFKKQKKEQAILVLAILLCLPVGFDIMTSIPRGFVTGLFFTSLFVVSLLNPKNYRFILINTFLAYVGYLVSQNSVIVSAPFFIYLFLINYKDKKYYIFSAIGFMLALPIDYLLNHFYKVNPNYILYGFTNDYSFDYFKEAILNLDKRFAHIGFFVEETSVIVLLTFIGIGILLFKKNKKLLLSYLLFLVIILVSFSSSKVNDGIVWPFYSYSRMYLGFPIIMYLMIVNLDIDFKKIMWFVIPIVFVFTVIKEGTYKTTLAYHVQEKMWGHVHLNTLKEIIEAVDITKRICIEQGVNDFVIVNSAWHDDEINYAGPAIYDDFPNTFKPSFERRTWRILEEKVNIHDKFVIYTGDYNYDKLILEQYKDVDITKINDYGVFLIKNNKRTTVEFIKHVKALTDGF
jgi:hypothetical protein